MKKPLKNNESESKAFAKVFVNRNTLAEERIKNYFVGVLEIANTWIIPLMKQFQIDVTFENLTEYVGEDIKSLFIDTLILRKAKGEFVPPTKYKQMYKEIEKDFETALINVIRNSQYIRKLTQDNAQAAAQYKSKIKSCEATLAKESLVGNSTEKEQAKKDLTLYNTLLQRVTTTGVERIRDEVESKKQEFSTISVENNTLKNQMGWFKITDDGITFDDNAITGATAVYADTPKEVKLIETLKQLAALTNEIYGSDYPGPLSAFCTFFTMEKGKVVLKPDIQKDAIRQYAKNM